MPGIDGWETIRRLRAAQLSDAPLAIVSANAFEKGVDNTAGIPAEDFILKPVRKAELLDWLGRALRLQWIDGPMAAASDAGSTPAAAPTAAEAAAMVYPPTAQMNALQAVIDLGYLRGIVRQLDEIEREHPACHAFVQQLRVLARQFQLDAMSGVLRQAQAGAAAAEPDTVRPVV